MPFDFDGEKYARSSAHQKSWGEQLMAELQLTGRERILDLGSGDGAMTARLSDKVPSGSVLGIDASRGMIEAAGAHRRDNLEFRLMDINAIDFAYEFDLIVSNATLHWIKDHETLLERVLRALKHGGLARFNFAAEGNCAHFFQVVRKMMEHDAYAGYFRDFEWPWYMPDLDAYQALVDRFPFREARVWEENADRHFPDAEAITGWIDQPSLVPFLAHIPEQDGQRFRDEVVARMLEITAQDDGTYFETFRRINLAAQK